MIMEELGLDYESVYIDVDTGDQKKEPNINYNPNGRLPTLVDHRNGDFAVWYIHLFHLSIVLFRTLTGDYRESCAIIQYLVEKYDTQRKLSFDNFEGKTQLLQWLFFQASGQGCASVEF